MHEVLPEHVSTELLQTLDDAVKAGKIGRFGIATSAENTVAIARTLRAGAVAQFPSNVFEPLVERVPNSYAKISHSAIGPNFATLYNQLMANKASLKKWSAILDLDCSDGDQLGRLFLYAAMTENAEGTVVFSSLDEKRIWRNAALMREPVFSSAQVELLWTLVNGENRRRPQAS
jgi:hypothetical protein